MSELLPETFPNAPMPLRKPSGWAVAIVWVAVGCMLAGGGIVLSCAFQRDTTSLARVFLVILACLFLLLPGRIAFVYVRRRARTGSWKMSEEERRENRAKWVGPKAERSIRRIDLVFKVMAPVLAVLFTLNALIYVRALIRGGFRGGWDWFYAGVWVLLAGYEIGGLVRKYAKSAWISGKEADAGNA